MFLLFYPITRHTSQGDGTGKEVQTTANTHNTSLLSKDNAQSITKLTKNQINLSFMARARLRNHFHSLPYISLNASFIILYF